MERRSGVRIDATGLTRAAGTGATVLDGVSLSVRPGELLAIVGGSGAGKTTLLDALAGVRPAQRGGVTYDGVDVYRNLDRFRTAFAVALVAAWAFLARTERRRG